MDKMRELVNSLNEANIKYYQENKSIISDFEYDKMIEKLKNMEEKTGIVLSNSPTQKVGGIAVENLDKVEHKKKMLSLDKTKNIGQVEEFLGDMNAIISYKMDGITIVLEYKNGELKTAITRGNGEIGEDVTHNFKVFKNVPLKIPYDKNIMIRGEAVISFLEFEKINEGLDEDKKYKNPRNLCSGSVRQLNNDDIKKRNINFLAFSMVESEEKFVLKSEQLEFLRKLGFDIVEYKITNKNEIRQDIKEFTDKIDENDFATDGLVITFNEIKYSLSLGETSKFPKDAIAFKWKDETKKTTLIGVEWNTSRTGLINPVAIFEPVELEGTTVARASLHNISIIKHLKIGIGDTISVYKANMIIPQIAENYTQSDSLNIPEICEECGGKAEIIEMREGLALKCGNEKCGSRVVNIIVHYASRNAMNIEGISKATIEKFVQEKIVQDYSDIYNIQKYKDKIIKMVGFGEKSYEKMMKSIEKSKNVHIENFIYALGIEHIGLSNAKLLAKTFDYDFEKIKNATFEELEEIAGFGEIMAKSVVEYFKNEKNILRINKVFCKLNILEKDLQKNIKLEGKTFVITGNLEKFENRKQLQEMIEKNGGKVTSSVSKNTDYLINNDSASTSSKNKMAKKLDIEIIKEEEFLKLIDNI